MIFAVAAYFFFYIIIYIITFSEIKVIIILTAKNIPVCTASDVCPDGKLLSD